MNFESALCDLGASVSSMPLSICQKLDMGDMEDEPIQVVKFFIPTDFIALEMDDDLKIPIILRRPFLETASSIIDVKNGKLTLNIGENLLNFNICTNLKKHSFTGPCCSVDVMDKLAKEIDITGTNKDPLEICLTINDDEETEYLQLLDSSPSIDSKVSETPRS